MAATRIDIFGGVRARVDGVLLPPMPSRPSGLLALLVLARCGSVGTTEFIDWLWGSEAVPSAGNQLQRMVGQLRRRFEPALEARSSGHVILATDDGYRLAESVEGDLSDLEKELADPDAASAHRAAVLQVIRKPPFAGLERMLGDHPWFVAVERQCAAIAIDALDAAAPGETQRDVVDLVQAVATRFPFEERLQAGLVRSLGLVGRRSEAMSLYDRVRTSLREDLGVDPGPDLQAAHLDVLNLDRPLAEPPKGPAQLPRVVGGLVARPQAQRLLDRVADAGAASAVLVTAIGGMGGIGKTTLAVAWAHQLAPRFPDGQLYLNLRGFDAGGDVMTTEEAIAALLTALGGASADAASTVDARSSLLRSRLAGRRYLLLLDNARDADQVRPLLPGDPGCLAIVTSRDRLTSLVTREGAVPIHLDRMDDEEAAELLARRLGQQALRADALATRAVLRACDGLPLALALVATRVALEPRLTLSDIAGELENVDLTSWSEAVGSDDLRSVFAWSFAALDEATVEAFQLIGTHPAARMSMASLISLLGRDRSDCVRTVRELCAVNLVQQLDHDHFALHDLLRAYAQAMPDTKHRRSDAERRLVSYLVHTSRNACATQGLTHSRPVGAVPAGVVPETFAGATAAHIWYPAEHAAISAIIALALRCGWTRDAANIRMDLLTFAARRAATPGEHAQQLLDVLTAAGGFQSDAAFDDPALLADVLRAIAVDQEWVGTFEQAEGFLARAERLVAGDRLARAQVLRGVARLHAQRKDYASAQAAFERALELADGEDGAAIRTRLYINIANTHLARGNLQAALDANDRSVATEMQQRSEGNSLIIAHINRAEILLALDRVDEALEALEAGRAAGGFISAYRASLLALQASAALRAGNRMLARRSVDEFREYVADHRAEGSGAEWSGGIEGLQTQIDEVDRALQQ